MTTIVHKQEIRDLIDKSCLDGHGIDQIGGYGGQFLMCSSKMWLVQTTQYTCCKSQTLVTRETFLIEDHTLGCVIYIVLVHVLQRSIFPGRGNFEVFHVKMQNISKWHIAILSLAIQWVSFLVFLWKAFKRLSIKKSSCHVPSYLTFIWYFWKVHWIVVSPL